MKTVIKFFSEAKNELMKVSWPTPKSAIAMTLTVLGVSVVFALFVTASDLVITQGIKWITEQSQSQASKAPKQINVPNVNLGDIQAIQK